MNMTSATNLIKLSEGNAYPFMITGVVVLPDGTEHYCLSDPNGIKHLLEKKWYRNYDFDIGQLITCRIDKINCSGKIYIEPLHPFYRLGKSYDFNIRRIISNHDKKDRNLVVLEDVFGNEVILSLILSPGPFRQGQAVRLKVTRIKNGKIFLSEPEFDIEKPGMISGNEYSFKISDFVDDPVNRSFFILTAENGSRYRIRYKYYEKYGLKIGQTIKCRFVSKGKELFFEPEHPVYKINHRYDFEITGSEVVPHYPDQVRRVYILKHDFGKKIVLPAEKVDINSIRNNRINCLVKDILKAKLILDCRKDKTASR